MIYIENYLFLGRN